jgi:hypothetical protein
VKLAAWLAIELGLIAFFVVGYLLYRRSRARSRPPER